MGRYRNLKLEPGQSPITIHTAHGTVTVQLWGTDAVDVNVNARHPVRDQYFVQLEPGRATSKYLPQSSIAVRLRHEKGLTMGDGEQMHAEQAVQERMVRVIKRLGEERRAAKNTKT